jgi:DNA-binding CsgD family transcriptional regulator
MFSHSDRTVWCLTPAESAVNELRGTGLSLRDVARSRGTSLNTVRTQLRIAREKRRLEGLC